MSREAHVQQGLVVVVGGVQHCEDIHVLYTRVEVVSKSGSQQGLLADTVLKHVFSSFTCPQDSQKRRLTFTTLTSNQQ